MRTLRLMACGAARRQATAPLLALALAAGCAHARGTPDAGPTGPRIRSLKVEGNRALADGTLTGGLSTQATGFWPWSTVRRLDPIALQVDLRRVETTYRLHGYFDARVVESRVEEVAPDTVVVVLRVEEGEPTSVAEVTIRGLEPLPEPVRRRALEGFDLVRGERFVAERYEAARTALEARLQADGYARARVVGQVDVYPAQRGAHVRLDAEPGEPHRYGELRVRGLAALPEAPVRAVVRRALPRGALFDPVAIRRAQSRLVELGAFSAANIGLAPRGTDPRDAPLVVRLEELPVHRITAGGSLSVQRGVQRAGLVAEYGHSDFLGGARRLVWRNDLELALSGTLPGRDGSALGGQSTLELVTPEILPDTDLAVRGGYQRLLRPAFEADAATARVALPVFLGPRARIVPSLDFENWFGPVGPRPVGPRPLPLAPRCESPCRLLYAGLLWSRDHRDDVLSPRAGTLLQARAQLGLRFPGDDPYLRLLPEARAYFAATQALVLAARAQLGVAVPLGGSGETPLVQRFFGGGDAGHRGFGADRLSPIVQTGPDEFAPVGGNGLWLLGAEARLRIGGAWGAVLFADWGDVTARALDLSPARAHLAVGAGLRYFTAAGPVRVDLAWRVNRRPLVALDTGAPADTGWADYLAFFVSLGEAF